MKMLRWMKCLCRCNQNGENRKEYQKCLALDSARRVMLYRVLANVLLHNADRKPYHAGAGALGIVLGGSGGGDRV